MKRTTILLLAGALLLGCYACTTFRGFHLMVNGFSTPDTPLRINSENSFFLIENGEAENPMFEKEVIRKASRLLETNGFHSASYEEADYLVVFAYGMGGESTVRDYRLQPLFDIIFSPDLHIGFRGFTFNPSYTGVSLHWMEIKVVDAKPYREEQKEEIIWLCQISSTSKSQDLREVSNYMLVGGFELFGVNTQKAVEIILNEWDERVVEISNLKPQEEQQGVD